MRVNLIEFVKLDAAEYADLIVVVDLLNLSVPTEYIPGELYAAAFITMRKCVPSVRDCNDMDFVADNLRINRLLIDRWRELKPT
ncbi:hypothetical protein IHQ71_26660 [Rhizobium sp. TH2]|uniref:hypothetical protein n=1 Tax=Rhizobium sp. TH2 TaxID=2775403 RepID=UPI00215893E6|nr:hypothetical protein [Rhizobium sp. TH2]UVC08668.1 hypothetical protein IHQ71_26660 [Rhizobium sp. TH2]